MQNWRAVSIFVVRLIHSLMATLSFSLSKKADPTGKHEVLARFVLGSKINLRAKTNVFAPAEYWNDATQLVTIPVKRLMNQEQRQLLESLNEINTRLQGIRAAVTEAFNNDGAGKKPLKGFVNEGGVPELNWLAYTIDKYNFPEKYETAPEVWYLQDALEDYLNAGHFSEWNSKRIKVVKRSLMRYEQYKYNTEKFLQLDTLTADDLRAFEDYLRHEDAIVARNKRLLKVCPESRPIEPRSENTISDRMRKLRTAFLFAVKNGRTTNNPFTQYSLPEAVYGTPWYITIGERNYLYSFNLSKRPALSVQRDIFIFQCLIGCRVSDLLKLTRSNLIDGAIEYIPRKTKDERAGTVRVPLNTIAAEIVARYENKGRKALLPFISAQKYNDAIKEVFKLAGLTRMVTVLDPKTRQEVQRPLNEIAASHLARRTFVGNLYKQVKDPNLIAKLSGHAEGSRAFARYRDIDEDIRKDLVKMLE